jgi:hypothetical protein
MRRLLEFVMLANAALFFFGAVQHAGFEIASFHEPRIIPAAIVEALCGFALAWGAVALLMHSRLDWRVALIANVVALGGVLLGIATLAAGLGPRTPSNDLYHRIMLVLIGIGIFILLFSPSAFQTNANHASNRR